MKRFRAGRRSPQAEAPAIPSQASAAPTLEIEELEPRLTPDYFGVSGSGGSGGTGSPGNPPSRSVGWGC